MPPMNSIDIDALMRRYRNQQAMNQLGGLGGSLMAASMGGMNPRDRALILGQGMQAFAQVPTGNPLQDAAAVARLRADQGEAEDAERRRKATQALMNLYGGSNRRPTLSSVAARTGEVGPTVGNAQRQSDLMALAGVSGGASSGSPGDGDLMGRGGVMAGPNNPAVRRGAMQALAVLNPEGFAKQLLEPPEAPSTQVFYDDQGREYRAQWNPGTNAWERVGGTKSPSAPSTRTRYAGGAAVQEEFVNGAWREIGRGPRFEPNQPQIREDPQGVPRYVNSGDPVFPGIEPSPNITPAQQASNAEIDAARRELASLGKSPQEAWRDTEDYFTTGRRNRNYDSSLAELMRRALPRKVGEDPEFSRLHRQYFGAEPPPIPEPFPLVPGASLRGGPSVSPGPGASSPSAALPRLPALAAPSARTPSASVPSAVPLPRSPRSGMRSKLIGQMNADDLAAYLRSRGGEDKLTPAERTAIEARIRALGSR